MPVLYIPAETYCIPGKYIVTALFANVFKALNIKFMIAMGFYSF